MASGRPRPHCEQWLGCCIFILQCLAPRPVPCFVNKTGTFATVLPHVTATVMPQALQTGDGGLVNVPRRFYSIFKDPFRVLFFSTTPLRFPVQGIGNPVYRVQLSATRFFPILGTGHPEVTLSSLWGTAARFLVRDRAMTLFPPFSPASLPLEMLYVLVRTVVSSASCTVFRQ